MGRLLDVCASNPGHPFIEPGKGREHTPFFASQTISLIGDSILAARWAPLYTQVRRVRQRIYIFISPPLLEPIGYVSPARFEAAYHQQTEAVAVT
jgi:hypothetical protein